jgi:hypothetical protein
MSDYRVSLRVFPGTHRAPSRQTGKRHPGGTKMGVCGIGLTCELICPAKKPGHECTLTMLEFAELLDTRLDVAPKGSEVLVTVGVV